MCNYLNIGECMTKLQSGREFCAYRKNQKRGDNSPTGYGRVTVLSRDTPSAIGGCICAIIWISVDAWQSYRAEGNFVHNSEKGNFRKGEIIHKRAIVEWQFFHATHLRLLGDIYVQLFEYRRMHDKVTERKGIIFENGKGEIIHQRAKVELQFLRATHPRLLVDMHVQLYEYRWMHYIVIERKGISTDRQTDWQTDWQTDRQTDRAKAICPPSQIVGA